MDGCLGIDIGGTSIKAALVSPDGVLLTDMATVPSGANPRSALARAAHTVLDSAPGIRVVGAGIGSPGYLDAARTTVQYSVNLGWRDYAIVDDMTQLLGMPVVLEGDAFVAAIGEALAGAGRGVLDVLAVTLGTGVGVAQVIDGVPMVGAHGLAGQAGHVPTPGIDAVCPCGRVGCWELAASTAALDRAARDAGFAGAEAALADAGARDIVDAWADAVATGLVILAGILDPGIIVIGGAASASADAFLPRLRERLDAVAPQVLLAPASLGGAAGTVGSGLLAWRRAT